MTWRMCWILGWDGDGMAMQGRTTSVMAELGYTKREMEGTRFLYFASLPPK